MSTYTLQDLVPDLPECCTKNKHSSSFRTSTDFSTLYPNLTPDECFTLSEQVSNTHPGTYQRKQVIDYYTQLNGSR